MISTHIPLEAKLGAKETPDCWCCGEKNHGPGAQFIDGNWLCNGSCARHYKTSKAYQAEKEGR